MNRASPRRSRARRARSCCAGIDRFGAFDRAAPRPQRAGGRSMYGKFEQHLESELQAIRDAGFYKTERVITTPQGSHVETASGGDLINLCANNYLGLAQNEEVEAAAREGLDRWG